ncbi:MAG: hypothetical protein RL105_1780 [Verrucomicrobiota bacterium]|jgi:hypothetical protein
MRLFRTTSSERLAMTLILSLLAACAGLLLVWRSL